MTNIVAALAVAIGGTSLIYYLVVKWGTNRKVWRESAGNDGASSGPVVSSSGESFSLLSWFSGNSSSPDGSSCASDSSSAESSTCSSDSSGGGDGSSD